MRILKYQDIDKEDWNELVRTSATGTWFQTPEAFDFFNEQKELFKPFVIAIEKSESRVESQESRELRGVCVGYVTVEKNPIKQFFTRRAIILGGPVLADDATDAEVIALLLAVKTKTRNLQSSDNDLHSIDPQSARKQVSGQTTAQSCAAGTESLQDSSQKHATLTKNNKNIFNFNDPIYIETRNFNDYSRWKEAFEAAGFEYKKHLNFHVDCSVKEAIWERLSDNRKRQIRKATESVQCEPAASESDIREWYGILSTLYRTKVKTPLWPMAFFLEAYRRRIGEFLMVKHEGKIIGGSMIVRNEGVKELKSEGVNGGAVYEWFECGMNKAYKEQYPSVMATYAGMEYAAAHGIPRYDMMGAGEPGVPYGVRDFKAEFGGEQVEHGRFLHICKPWLYRLGVFVVRIMKK